MRKVKCTGHQGQGTVCDRCKLAGFGPSDCQLPEVRLSEYMVSAN